MAMSDKTKADFFLLGVIGTFLFLTFIAFLMNEGKELCILPLLKFLFPNRRFGIKKQNSNDSNDGNGEEVLSSIRSKKIVKVSDKKRESTLQVHEMNTIHEYDGMTEHGDQELRNVADDGCTSIVWRDILQRQIIQD